MTISLAPKAAHPNVRDTADLEFTVENALAMAEDIDGADVFVTVNGSKIVLSGWLATEEEIDRAEEIAVEICGAARIDNQIVKG